MKNDISFGIIGGDIRQVYLAEAINDDDFDVRLYGFDKLNNTKYLTSSLPDLINSSDYVILPMPFTKDSVNLNAPFSNDSIHISDLTSLLKNKYVFSGKIQQKFNFKNSKLYDYSSRDDFAILNAIPTAEAALQIAMSKRVKTIYKSKCLVSGFGRIGKVLSRLLFSMGANLTVSARNPSDIAWIKSLTYNAVHTSKIKNSGKYDIIFNTVPHKIFDKETLLNCTSPETLIIDLASAPGGIDFDFAKSINVQAIHALALPGKFTPHTAAQFIKQTIYNIIREENIYE